MNTACAATIMRHTLGRVPKERAVHLQSGW